MSGFERNMGVSRWRNGSIRKQSVYPVRRRLHLFFFLLGGFSFVFLLCWLCWQKDRMVGYGYRMEALKKEITQLEEAYNRLKLEQASLLTPSRINQIAQEQLGMTTPVAGQILFDKDIPNFGSHDGATAAVEPLRKSVEENRSHLR